MCRNPTHIWNDLSEFAKVDEKLDEFAEQFGVPPAIAATFHIIFDDLLNNVISYGFNDEQRHFIDISLELTANSLIVSITDDGVPFNPLTETAIESNLDTHVSFPVNETVSKSSFWRLRFADGTLPADFFQAVVWSLLVVFVDPIACDLARLAQRFEHVSVEHLVAEGSVEALDVGTLIRLARLDVAQVNVISAAPVRSTKILP